MRLLGLELIASRGRRFGSLEGSDLIIGQGRQVNLRHVQPVFELLHGLETVHLAFEHDVHNDQIGVRLAAYRIASSVDAAVAGTAYPSRCRLSWMALATIGSSSTTRIFACSITPYMRSRCGASET